MATRCLGAVHLTLSRQVWSFPIFRFPFFRFPFFRFLPFPFYPRPTTLISPLLFFSTVWQLPTSTRRSGSAVVSQAEASPVFVARGKAGNQVMGHSRRTSRPGAAAAWWLNSFVTNAVLMERAEMLTSVQASLADYTVSGYLDSWQSDLL